MKHHFSIIFLLTFLVFPQSVPEVIRPGAPGKETSFKLPAPKFTNYRDTIEITITGDVMMHSRQMEYPMETFLEKISHVLKEADICIAGAEFTLGGKPYSGYPCFSAPDEYAGYLRDCGVDVFLTANNHIFDRGAKGLSRTLGLYRSLNGVNYTGSGSDESDFSNHNPLIIKKKNFTFALINFTYGTNSRSYEEYPRTTRMKQNEIEDMFDRARAAGADFVIALPHFGDEYILEHNETQERWADWLVAQGADAVVGAHPHVVQDFGYISSKPVFYSLGNLVSNMSAENTRLGLVVTLRFEYDWFSGEKRQLEPVVRPTWCTLPGTLTNSYSTVFIDEWISRRSSWISPSDYDNMKKTSLRVLGGKQN